MNLNAVTIYTSHRNSFLQISRTMNGSNPFKYVALIQLFYAWFHSTIVNVTHFILNFNSTQLFYLNDRSSLKQIHIQIIVIRTAI